MTRAYLAPPMVLALAKQPIVDQFDLSTLKTIGCAAAPLSQEVARACAIDSVAGSSSCTA